MGKKYNIEALNALPIDSVIEALGGRASKNKKLWHCPNLALHSNDDKKPSLGVSLSKNVCNCFSCGLKGGPVAVAKQFFEGDFKKACEWLHSTFNIPFNDDNHPSSYSAPVVQKKAEKPVAYWNAEEILKSPYKPVEIKMWIHMYPQMKPSQRLKLIYSYIYRFSMAKEREFWRRDSYYLKRGIEPSPKNIGVITSRDVSVLVEKLIKIFPLEDLLQYKILKEYEGKYKFIYYNKWGFLVVPSYDLGSDLNTGLVFRGLFRAENDKAPKEFVMKNSDILTALPYGLTRSVIQAPSKAVLITEGHIDALSVPSSFDGFCIAVPGVYNIKDEELGLLKGRKVIIAFDQDAAGQEAAKALAKKLLKAGATPQILTWDSSLGKDLNEVLCNNGYIEEIF